MTTAERIEAALRGALDPAHLEVRDDSARHEGHAGARPGGETHFRVTVVAAAFAGLSRVERQRRVYALLSEEFAAGLHALELRTLTPEEAERQAAARA